MCRARAAAVCERCRAQYLWTACAQVRPGAARGVGRAAFDAGRSCDRGQPQSMLDQKPTGAVQSRRKQYC
eukprot:370367-Pleurochrysis_carterae.AAC.5